MAAETTIPSSGNLGSQRDAGNPQAASTGLSANSLTSHYTDYFATPNYTASQRSRLVCVTAGTPGT